MKRTITVLSVFAVLALFAGAITSAWAADGCCGTNGKAVKSSTKASCPMTSKSCPKTADSSKCPYMKSKPGACPMTKGKAVKSGAKVVSAVCPVMGNKIPDVKKAAGKSIYKGKTYYFCCGMCKPKFDKNPEQYIKKAPKK